MTEKFSETVGEYLFWSYCPNVGPVRVRNLIERFGSVKEAALASERDLAGVLGTGLAGQVDRFRRNWNRDSVFLRLEKVGIEAICLEDKSYPESLKNISGGPLILYIRKVGGRSLIDIFSQKAIAVVGSRRVTSYGREMAEGIVVDLVRAGVGVVSGMMYGVDEVAHRAAILGGGLTIGVWAGGINSLWGTSRAPLAKAILESGGLIVSEFPPEVVPTPGLFPARNRIVSGLSLATVVVEASVESGSLITAGCAAEQGREVFAVPGPVTSPQSLGTAKLIQKGAMLVTSGSEVLETMGI